MGYRELKVPLIRPSLIVDASASTLSGYIAHFPVAASGHHVGANWIAPKAGNISEIGVICTYVSGATPPTYKLCIEGVNTSKDANGTIAAQTNGFIPSVSSGYHFIPLTSPLAVTEGTNYTCTVRLNSGTIDGSNCAFFGFVSCTSSQVMGYISPFAIRNNGSLATPIGLPMVCPKYSDGTIPKVFVQVSSGMAGYSSVSFNSGSTFPLKGLAFSTPFACKIDSLAIATAQLNANSHLEIRMYDYNNNLILNRAYPANQSFTGSQGSILVEFASGIEIQPNRTYRIVLNPTGTANIYQFYSEFSSYNQMSNYLYNISGYMTEGSGSPPAWQDYNNPTLGYRIYAAVPFINAIATAGRRRAR